MDQDALRAAERLVEQRMTANGTPPDSVKAVQKSRDAILVTVTIPEGMSPRQTVVTMAELR